MANDYNTASLLQRISNLEEELKSLKEKNRFLEEVVNRVPANIYISSLDKRIVWCNRTNEESLGYTLEEIQQIGTTRYLKEILHPDDQNIPEESIEFYNERNETEFGGVFRAKHKTEQQYRWFIGWAKTFRKDAQGNVEQLLCVDVDMSPQMNTESQLIEALKENLRQKNRLLINSLRNREIEILTLICKGMRTKDIAEKLFISVNTVSTHRRNIQKKLGTANIADMVSLAREAGLG